MFIHVKIDLLLPLLKKTCKNAFSRKSYHFCINMRWRFCPAILTHSASKSLTCNIRSRVIVNLNWSNHNVCHLIQETVSGQLYVHSDIYLMCTQQSFVCNFLFLRFFFSIFILLTRRKPTEALIHRVSNYPDLLPEMPRYRCSLVIL